MTVRKCSECGALHPKVISWMDSLQREFFFCNMVCKEHFLKTTYPSMLVKERENEIESASILPQVREFIAHKNKNGSITVVRGDCEIHSGAATREGEHKGHNVSGEAQPDE